MIFFAGGNGGMPLIKVALTAPLVESSMKTTQWCWKEDQNIIYRYKNLKFQRKL
jgi:hypothetical protein